MRQLIAGNWKMNGTASEAVGLAAEIREGTSWVGCEVLICPTSLHVAAVATVLRGSPVRVGGQDCHEKAFGPHTGDISASMLADVGASSVILGHSERRAAYGETDARVRAKAAAAAAAGLVAIICVGESEAERKAGQAAEIVAAQIAGSVPDGFDGSIAYEPIWAIGTGVVPSLEQVADMHRLIRGALRERLGAGGLLPRILYGGSVNPKNAADLLRVPEVGGALVGGASLQAGSFLAIAAAALH